MRGRHLVFVLLATIVMASISLWAGPSPQVLGQVNITIMMRDSLAFEPGSFSAAPGESVSLTLINAGAVTHTFTLFDQANANVPVNDNAALQAYYNDAANPKLVDMSFSGGAQQSTSFTAPMTAGTYIFVCMEPAHSSGGMHGTMTVTSTPDDGPAPIDPLLIGVVIAVVVIIIAGAAVFVLRRRS